jgi:hypothetical protein
MTVKCAESFSTEVELDPRRADEFPGVVAKIVMRDRGDELVRDQLRLGPARLERRGDVGAIAFFRLGQQMVDLGVVGREILRQPAVAHPEAAEHAVDDDQFRMGGKPAPQIVVSRQAQMS